MTDASALGILRSRLGTASLGLQRLSALFPALDRLQLPSTGSVITTGVGASEGPARLLAALLRQTGRNASYVPLSAFHPEAQRELTALRLAASTLVVFSQQLSPNATWALAARSQFQAGLLLCSQAPHLDARVDHHAALGFQVLRHPPDASEDGVLLRVSGPLAACAMAILLAHRFANAQEPVQSGLSHTSVALQTRSFPPFPELSTITHPPALLVAGPEATERFHCLKHCLLEGLLLGEPPCWDLLGFAHGPFQSIYSREALLLCPYDAGDARTADLLSRVESMLDPSRHRVVRLPATLEPPWSLLEHLFVVQHLTLGLMQASGHGLRNWPGQGRDAALYEFGTEPRPMES